MKAGIKKLLTDTHHRHYFLVSDLLAVTTIISIVSIVLETVPALAHLKGWFDFIEWTTVAIFSVEYISRFYIAPKKVSYVFSLYGIIDLISIAPTYLGLGNLTFLKSARVVRLMRLLRLLRVSKMKHLRGHDVDEHLSFYAINALLFLTVLISALLLAGILIYLVEGTEIAFQSIPHGMWWAFRIFTGDQTFDRVTTDVGQVVYIFTRLIGLTVFGVLIGVLGNVVRNGIFGGK